MDLRARFLRFVRRRRLFSQGDRVLVALSGGVDSVVLLHLLHNCRYLLGIEVVAAHFDHAMRADSAADADWVKAFCEARQIKLVMERSHRPLHGETDARIERYRFLQDVRQRHSCNRVATAHHADDQAETILFRLLRGTGLRGLAGIPLKRGPFVRPLLPFRKQALIDYATSHNLPHRDDPTNEELKYVRNRIRHLVIPALQIVRPDAVRAVLKMARHAARTESAWNSLLKEQEAVVETASHKDVIELARPKLLEYHAEFRARLMRRYLRRFGIVPARAHTASVLHFVERAQSGAVLPLGAVQVERAFDTIRIRKAHFREANGSVTITGNRGHARLQLPGRAYHVAWRLDDVPLDHAERFAPQVMELRGWRAGDRIRLAYGTKKLKKLFAEHRVPASERRDIPVLINEDGQVTWVKGIARSGVPPETGPFLNITVTNAEPS